MLKSKWCRPSRIQEPHPRMKVIFVHCIIRVKKKIHKKVLRLPFIKNDRYKNGNPTLRNVTFNLTPGYSKSRVFVI